MRTIKLTNFGRLEDRSPFVLPDKLELDFNSVGYDLSEAFITLQNGEIKGRYKLTRPFTVPDEFLFDGFLNIAVNSYYKGELYKHWDILPLRIKESDGNIECFDLLSALETKIETLENRVKELEELHEVIM